jgi:hypothetical protein
MIKITTTVTTEVSELLNRSKLECSFNGSRDANSVHLAISYKDEEIAMGHFNFKSGIAHVELEEDLYLKMDSEEAEDLKNYLEQEVEEFKF